MRFNVLNCALSIYAAGDLVNPAQGALLAAASGTHSAAQLNHALTVELATAGVLVGVGRALEMSSAAMTGVPVGDALRVAVQAARASDGVSVARGRMK